MSKIDEILREHLVLATDDGQPYIKYTDDAIAQLLQLVLDEVIGEPEDDDRAYSANILRQQQRQKAIKLFGGEDEPR